MTGAHHEGEPILTGFCDRGVVGGVKGFLRRSRDSGTVGPLVDNGAVQITAADGRRSMPETAPTGRSVTVMDVPAGGQDPRDLAPEQRTAAVRYAPHLVAGLVFVLAGILFAASATTARGTDLRGGRAVETRDLVARQAQRVAEAEATVAALGQQVADLAAAQGSSAALAVAQKRTLALAPQAGLTPVVGPGVRVTLDDAPRGGIGQNRPGNPAPNDLVVHQQDVQAVVNALWRGGASAVQVMDQRIVSTSAVRCVGNTLILQGRVYSPPFVISAVGDPAVMTESLDNDRMVSIYREYVDLYGLGYLVRTESSMTVPPFTGSIEPAVAQIPAVPSVPAGSSS
jgi:uncharacterized protein YlxW (UPF0749 family)